MSQNKLRAEKQLEFGDKTYTARISLDVVSRIEQALGCSILKVGTKLASADLTINETMTILLLSIRAGGNDIKDSDMKQMIAEVGLVESLKMCGDLLTLALDTGEDNTDTFQKKT
tara:strand:+ start:320 stop:664 length:345 start_codon:yes stop_codon:yes gene_type:complete